MLQTKEQHQGQTQTASGEKLLVSPLCWTHRHLELLNCAFVTLDAEESSDAQPISSHDELEIARFQHLLACDNFRLRQEAITSLVITGGTNLIIASHPRRFLFVPDLLRRVPRGPYEPVALFFDQEFLRSLRWNALRPRDAADGTVNEPAFHIAEKRLRTMTPRNSSEDPFILAALVAMAQSAAGSSLQTHGDTLRPEEDSLPILTAPARLLTNAPPPPKSRLPAFLDHFSKRELKVFFRCWAAAWSGSILMFIGPTLRTIGTATFFAGLVVVIIPPSGIVFVYILGSVTLLIGVLLGWGWGALVMKVASLARPAPETAARVIALRRAAAQRAEESSTDVATASQMLVHEGFMLDVRVTVVTYCLICIFIYVLARLRGARRHRHRHRPRLLHLPLPRSTSHVVLDTAGDILQLLHVPLRFASSTLGGAAAQREDEENLAHLRQTRAKIIAASGQMEACLAFLPLDFSVGRWGPRDVKDITEGLKTVMTAAVSLLDFHTGRIANEASALEALRTHALETDSLEAYAAAEAKPHEIGGQQKLQLGAFIRGLRWSDNQPLREETVRKLITASEDAMGACLEGIEAAGECIAMVNRCRWFGKPSPAERQQVSARCHAALLWLRKARPAYIRESTDTVLDAYLRTAEPGTAKDPHAWAAGRLRSLVIGMVYEEHVVVAMAGVEGFIDRVVTTFDASPRTRLWSPANFHKASAWAFDKNARAPDMAPASEEDPDKVLASRTKKAEERLRVRRGHYSVRRNPVGQAISATFDWLTNPEGLYALRMVIVTIATSIPGLLPQTAGFFYREKGIWALIMAQTGLVLYMADFTFSVMSRILGSVNGGVLGLAVWYIGSGNGPGNPYGLSGAMAVALVVLVWCRYADVQNPSYGNPGVGYNVFWRRLLLALIGIAAATVVQIFPARHRQPSTSQGHSLTLSAPFPTTTPCFSPHGADPTPTEPCSRGPFPSMSTSLSMLDGLIGVLRYEISSSPFDSQSLRLIKGHCEAMNRNLARLLALSGTLPIQYQDRLAAVTGALEERNIGEVMSVLSVCEQSLKTADALPEALPAPLVTKAFEHWQSHHPNIDPALDPELMRDDDYRRFCVALSTYMKFLGDIDELVLVLKDVLGESHLIARHPQILV
ncbi:unnamed protein product [Parascedosporium putredinis]|uniref:ER transporter 6TM N-terminal domain-containing protein n=1 Tax=Parascedosporium putredinis TaxID=1442378 RepID=A0A9P1M8K1_9PEZI|nr:unnamed protein product [Parascedosporium putredinis]CAI7990268.1 unnamed protein product [Parascedosporium putredinis]